MSGSWIDDPIQGTDPRPVSGTIVNSTNVPSNLGLVSPAGIINEQAAYPFNISGTPASTDIGKCVAIDPTAPNTVRLAQPNDIIFGVLASLEARTQFGITVCTVFTKGAIDVPYDTTTSGDIPVVGNSVTGAVTAGLVYNLAAAAGRTNVVTNVNTTNNTCTVVFL